MKKPLLIAGGVTVLAALVLISVLSGGRGKGTKVYAEQAARRSITQSVKASGQIQPRVKVNLSAHVIGKIEKLYVVEGQSIAAGEPFLELERQAFLAERDNARAQLAKALSDVSESRVALADQSARLNRARRLAQEGISSAEAREAAELAHTSGELRLDQARESEKQARAFLIKAEDDLRKTTIFAPLSGRVIALNAEQGEVVVSGTMNNPASVIGTIADLSEILAEIDVDETEIVHLAVGQSAAVRVDALPDASYAARVVEIGSSGYSKPAQPDVTFFLVKLLMETPAASLRPGMSASADISVATHESAVVVPIQSVVEREEKRDGDGGGHIASSESAGWSQGLFVVDKGEVRRQSVRTGISDATHVEIVEGLAGGEQIVTGPYRILRRLEDGERVQLTRPDLEKGDGDEKQEEEDG